MEASKISFFKATEEKIKQSLSLREKKKLRLDKLKKQCPDSGVPLRDFMKIAGYDPSDKKQYKAGMNFIYSLEKSGDVSKVIDDTGKRKQYLYFMNSKVVTTKKSDKEKLSTLKDVKIIDKKLKDINVYLSANDGEYTIDLSLKNTTESYVKKIVSVFLENVND